MTARPSGHTAVMAQRVEPPDALDYFPTPPWATRALCEHVAPIKGASVWEPACGEGHMGSVLREYARSVTESDVHPHYDGFYWTHDFLQPFMPSGLETPEWIITNPPFALADEFAERALQIATHGVALLVRSVWAEGAKRYQKLFSITPPTIIAQFCERVPMTKGRWNPDASTATAYSWFIWAKKACLIGDQLPGEMLRGTRFVWIPPGCRQRLTRPDDRARFAGRAA